MIFATRYMKKGQKDAFVGISVDLLDVLYDILSYSEISMLLFIAKNERNREHISEVSISYIAEGMGCSTATARRGLQRLQEVELIEKTDGGYRLLQHETEDFLKSLIAKNATAAPSKNYQRAVAKIARADEQKLLAREKGSSSHVEKGGEEAAAGLRLVTEKEDLGIYSEMLVEQSSLAKIVGNPVIQMSYFADNKKLPQSFFPKGADYDNPDLYCRAVFLTVTNIICDEQTMKGNNIYVLPQNRSELDMLGNVVANFLQRENWEGLFRRFYNWVMNNKEDLGYNRLGFYLGDWLKVDLSANRDFRLRSI